MTRAQQLAACAAAKTKRVSVGPPASSVVTTFWNPADVAMYSGSGAFSLLDGGVTVTNPTGVGGVIRSTSSKAGAGNKRYVELVIDNMGDVPGFMSLGFWKASGTLLSDCSQNVNENLWIIGGARYSYGQTNTDASSSSLLGLSTGDVLQLAIDIGTGWMVDKNNGGIWAAGPSFTETDVKIFAGLGDGVYGPGNGVGFAVRILGNAANQNYPALSGYTPWDD